MTEQEAWDEFHQAETEEDYIWGQMDWIFKKNSDRCEAIKQIILEGHTERMKQAVQKSRNALNRWLSIAKDENGI